MYIHNAFVDLLQDLKDNIQVGSSTMLYVTRSSLIIDYQSPTSGKISTTMDLWSADQTKASFFGLTAHWIQVDQSKKWNIKSHVIAFQAISGAHTGDNIGRYFMGLCDRVGVISWAQSKVRTESNLSF